MITIATIQKFITQHNLINKNDTIIIGLSGGPDSVFLLHLLIAMRKEYNLTLIAAHLNHGWRPQADAEEEMCRTIAQEQSINFIAAPLSSFEDKIKYNGSKEEYARNIRRIFLKDVAQKYNAQRIALGHHLDDQQETFFIRLIRGSGLTGLTGIKPKTDLYIRPLLETTKADIVAWLSHHQITYALDLSNDSPEFLRNRIRATVTPALRKCDERFNANFLQTLYRLQEDEAYIIRMTEQAFKNITTRVNNTIILNTTEFSKVDAALHHRIIMHWLIAENVKFPITTDFFNEIIRFLLSPRGGTHQINPGWSIVKYQNNASIS